MEQFSKNSEKFTGHNMNVQKMPLVEITRTFNAPIETAWKAWSDSEMAKQWWGPEGFTAPEAKIDFRQGGKSLLAMKDPQGKITYSIGEYEEIIPYKKIVCTDQFADKNGKPISANEAGLPGDWPMTCYITVLFNKISDHQTQINLTHEGIPKVMHDDCVSGWNSSLDKMQRLVEKN
jgi:uncharacterized protein YndB with AHSA1/START domain